MCRKFTLLMTLHFNYHSRWQSGDNQSVRSSAPVVSRWLWPGNRTSLEVASMVVTWWIAAFLRWTKPYNPPGAGTFCQDGRLPYLWPNINIISINQCFSALCLLSFCTLCHLLFHSLLSFSSSNMWIWSSPAQTNMYGRQINCLFTLKSGETPYDTDL